MARSPRPAGGRRRMRRTPALPLLLVGLVIAGAVAAGYLTQAAPADPVTDCPVGKPPPATVVIDLDTTDALIAAQPRQTLQAVEQVLAGLPAGSRVAILQVSGENQIEAAPLFDRCLPATDDNIRRNRMRDAVMTPIRRRLQSLQAAAAAPASPILESVLNIAQDRQLHAAGAPLTVVLISDALQNSEFASVYRRGRAFPDPAGRPLAGVRVQLVLLRNRRDQALQPASAARLTAWLGKAGATTDYRPPTWLTLAGAPP